jgi:probable DNA metabolism protein
MTLIYDGSFESFLSLVYDVYYQKLKVKSIQKQMPQTLFLDDILEIDYDEIKTKKVLQALKTRFQKRDFETILNIFMCDSVEFELHLLRYIILGFRDSKELANINNESVFFIQSLQKELFSLNHKMTGFIRFEELEDKTLYAKIDTKFNIVYFLAKHFMKRFNNQKFIIHDTSRDIAFMKNDEFMGIREVANVETPLHSKDEQKFQKLWHTFFESVSIQSRKNEKAQKQFVPLIYRVYMSEFQ